MSDDCLTFDARHRVPPPQLKSTKPAAKVVVEEGSERYKGMGGRSGRTDQSGNEAGEVLILVSIEACPHIPW